MINLSFLQDFPKDFNFGVATSSYQIEGTMYGNCGKSIWDDFAERKLNGIDGKLACNHIEYFKEDIKLIKDAGFKTYRFSFAWPRLFPDNNKDVNLKGVDFYKQLLEEINNCDLEAFPTIYHWDLPIRFQKIKGWEDQEPCKHFGDFSFFISKTFGDQFEKISTINEPWCISWLSHYLGEHAPGIKNIQSAAKTMHNILFAHSQSVEALRSCNAHQIGIVLNNQFGQPIDSNEKNIQATKLFDEIHNRWFSDAIFKGKYPELALSILEKYLPENYKTQLELISSPIDWIGLNYYTRSLIKYKKSDYGVNYECNSGTLKKTDMGWEFYPEGLSYFIKRINKEYDNNIPIYITENGMANNDKLSLGNSIKDHDRIEFFNIHLKEVLNCVNEKLPVKGYFAWSLLDNYEWAFGYSKRFGLVFTDFQNFKRIPKNSYYEFQKYLK